MVNVWKWTRVDHMLNVKHIHTPSFLLKKLTCCFLFLRAIQTLAQKSQFRSNNDIRTDSVVIVCFDL